MCIRDRGATGAVGEVMLSILAERKFPISELVALASERSAGSHIDFGDDEVLVQDVANFDPVSYTHLDVYKRQAIMCGPGT